jgi:hypothetical protein
VQLPPPYLQVASTSYTKPTNIAFDVTVTAYQTTINCWDDAHQTPVLATTSDVSVLDYNSAAGQWTEFLYTTSRPYPSIMAAASYVGTLPTMQFYANGIPNGRYKVIANLYDNAPMRYFFGYTSANPSASYVDTVGGLTTGTQHREYNLGTVEITDNAFNLYVNDAQRLSGAYDIFGWAWIRLEPAQPPQPTEITINLYDNNHQDPVLTTTQDVNILTNNSSNHLWTEFLYTTSRPYPSVMGSALHTPVTPTMHFYSSGIPNGQYQVYANLYDTNPLRYMYGFTSSNPQALFVDTTGGATGTQHREYSLGTIDITNGSFDLYVNRADELSGATYDIFGWAWIRLVPQFTIPINITLSSSSSTMIFDGDGDGTFGEVGDNIKPLVNGTLTIAARDTTAGQPTITATDFLGQTGSHSYTLYSPTAVTVSSFSGASRLGSAQLDWETANEVGLVGFNLYRSETLDGPKQKLNADLIPAQYPNQMLGAAYQLIDAVDQGQRYYYWLELVRTNGTELLEPVIVDADYLVRLPILVR